MRWHVRAGHLQYLRSLDTDAADDEDGPGNFVDSKLKMIADALPCELGIRYPTLQAILARKRPVQTTLVSNQAAMSYTIS
jgi:hypothetical protein